MDGTPPASPRSLSEGFQKAPRSSQEPSSLEGSQKGPRSSQKVPRSSQKAFRRLPEGFLEAPRRLPEGSQKVPEGFQKALRRLLDGSEKLPVCIYIYLPSTGQAHGRARVGDCSGPCNGSCQSSSLARGPVSFASTDLHRYRCCQSSMP